MQNRKNKKEKRALVFKPYLKGSWHNGEAIKRGLRILMYYFLFALMNLLVGSILQFDSAPLRWIVNLLIIGLYAVLLYAAGSQHGTADVALGEIAYSQREAGKEGRPEERARCYHPMKGVFTALVGVALLVVIALPFALTAQKQVYSLQALPSWVSAYESREEIGLPLAYYQQEAAFGGMDVLRIIVRVLVFPFANLATAKNADGMLLVDRLSPLLICLPALGYPLGYWTGPRNRAQVHGEIQTADKKYRRRQRRAVKARQQRAAKKNELI